MSAHTPGPWLVESLHNADALGKVQWRITAVERQRVNRVADIYPDLSEHWDKKPPNACLGECAADARLIAAAPDGYALAVAVAAHFEGTNAPLGQMARDFIAKATETP